VSAAASRPRVRARKRFGQHFLEPAWVAKVVQAIAPRADETFLEIGPGLGALTAPLAARAARVVAVEIDRDLAGRLAAAAIPRVEVLAGDALTVPIPELARRLAAAPGPVRAAGNLPYNVASPILFRLIDLASSGIPLRDAVLMLQREVAVRLLASPGSRDYGVLTVLVGRRARISQLLALPPGAFRPPPKVRSALVRLDFHPPSPPVRDERLFAALVQAVFTRRRKMLANALLAFPGVAALPAGEALERAGLDGRRRPETLSAGELARLSDVFAAGRRAVL